VSRERKQKVRRREGGAVAAAEEGLGRRRQPIGPLRAKESRSRDPPRARVTRPWPLRRKRRIRARPPHRSPGPGEGGPSPRPRRPGQRPSRAPKRPRQRPLHPPMEPRQRPSRPPCRPAGEGAAAAEDGDGPPRPRPVRPAGPRTMCRWRNPLRVPRARGKTELPPSCWVPRSSRPRPRRKHPVDRDAGGDAGPRRTHRMQGRAPRPPWQSPPGRRAEPSAQPRSRRGPAEYGASDGADARPRHPSAGRPTRPC
jgi:hypothetical protein